MNIFEEYAKLNKTATVVKAPEKAAKAPEIKTAAAVLLEILKRNR